MNTDDISKELPPKKSILARISQKLSKLTKYLQESNFGIGHMSGGTFKDNTKVAGKFEENNSNQSQDIANHVTVNLNQQDKLNFSKIGNNIKNNQKIIKASVKQGDIEYSAEAPTVEELVECMTSLKKLFNVEVKDIEKGSIKFILKGSEEGLNNIVKSFKSGELAPLLKQQFNLELENAQLIDSNSSENVQRDRSQKLLAFTIAGDVSQADIDILKATLIDTSEDNKEIRNEEKSHWNKNSLILNINQLEPSAKSNHRRHNKMTGNNRNIEVTKGNYNESIQGNYYEINAPTTFGENSPLTIYEGDPPEVRQRKLEQAKKLIAEEVLTNIDNMDARLSYLADVLENDNFDKRLQDVRGKVAPSLSEIFDSGYRQLIRQQEISSLRGAFTSRPLYEIREPLIQVLVDGNTDPEKVRAFYNSLTEVRDASESLFKELSTTAQETSTNPKIIAHQEKSVKLAIETLINRSQTAHIHGLSMLDSLKIPLPNAQERLSYFQHLKPNGLVSADKANQLLAKQIEEIQLLIKERIAIVEEAETILDDKLIEYEQLNEKLTVQPSDTWNEVVAKATILRKFGRTSEAIAAFSRYGDMFAEKDPTAKQYSGTAQQFTIQLDNLGVEGGVYIYEIIEDGVANKTGLKVGDIIIKYNENNIVKMEDFIKAQKKNLTNDSIRLTYLRMSNTGIFERQTITVKAGSLSARLMPI